MTDAMEAEFDLVAEWTRQAVRRLGEDHALPAACQGSASPAALDWLALREVRRVLADHGDLGLLVFERHAARLHGTPEGNDFPTAAELDRQIRASGFLIVDRETITAGVPARNAAAVVHDRGHPGEQPRVRHVVDDHDVVAEQAVATDLAQPAPARVRHHPLPCPPCPADQGADQPDGIGVGHAAEPEVDRCRTGSKELRKRRVGDQFGSGSRNQ